LRWTIEQESEMALQRNKMICPKCGDAMNHHADKLVYPTEPHLAGEIDPSLGGVIEETHTCPGCSAVESRIAGKM
jgi:ribosomal protein S27AE